MTVMAQGEAGAARALDPLLLGLVLVSAYVLLVATGLDDADLLRSTRIWRFGLDIDAAAGVLDLPAVGRAVSISEFFLIAPGLVLALHVAGMIRLRARLGRERFRGPLPWPLVAGSLIAGPAALIGLQAEYAPFAAIRPTTGAALSDWWMSLWHVAAIGIAGVSLLLIQGAPDDPARNAAPGPGPGRALRLTLAAAISALAWRAAARVAPVVFPNGPEDGAQVAAAAPGPVLAAAALALAPLAALALLGAPRAAPVRPGRMRRSTKGETPMMFRTAGLTLAAAAFAQIAGARSIDVAGETLAQTAPSEALVAAYVVGAGPGGGARGWAAAYRDHARGVDLSAWRVDGAVFDRAFLPNARFDHARLRRASFDGAVAPGASFRHARLAGASLRGARPGAPIRLAQAGFTGLDLVGADLRGAILSTKTVPTRDAAPEDGETWDQWCDDNGVGDFNQATRDPEAMAPDWFLTGARLDGAILDDAVLFGMDLTHIHSMKDGTSFKGADLRCARVCKFLDSRGEARVFEGATLAGVVAIDCETLTGSDASERDDTQGGGPRTDR